MSEKVKSILLFAVPFLIYLVISLAMTRFYLSSSFESYKFCVEQVKEANLPTGTINLCSHISSAINTAYFSAIMLFNPIIIVLLTSIFLFGKKMNSMSKELKEIKEKLNV